MDSLFILIPIALCFVAVAIKAFLWAVKNKQYDDLDAAAYSILFDEDADLVAKQKTATKTDKSEPEDA